MVHLILLIQFTNNVKTRRYHDCESIAECVKYICSLYEESLKKRNQNMSYITYDIMNLYQYIDEVILFNLNLSNTILIFLQMHDLSVLIDRFDGKNYRAYAKEWIKQKIFHVLRDEVVE